MDMMLEQQAQATIERGSKSFAAAARLFDPATRRDARLLYTWCRHCDDVTDGQEFGRGRCQTASPESLERMQTDSLAALGSAPSDALPYKALAEVARRHPISPALVEAHIRGFELDFEGWQPESLDDTLQYSYHAAGSVGVMMALIMGVRDEATLHRACDLGIAFQLTNIARDVAEDASAGRCYLPARWLAEAGLDVADLAGERCPEKVFPLVRRLVGEAEPYYDSAAIGMRALPRRAAWAIATARAVYRDIGRIIVRRGAPALNDRVYTGKGRKVWRIVTSIPAALPRRHPARSVPRNGLWTPPAIS